MDKRRDPHTSINAVSELEKIRLERSIKRRKGRRFKSKLEPHHAELLLLYKKGANYEELSYWLAHKKKLKIHPTTIMRYLKTLPEQVGKNA